MRKSLIGLFATVTLGATALLAAPGAVAGTSQPVPKATGGIALAGPAQYLSFNAFQSVPVKGSVNYTNFTYQAPGSGVWAMDPTFTLTFSAYGRTWPWLVTVGSVQPTSNTSYSFTGTAASLFDSTTATVTGTLSGTTLSMHMDYVGWDPAYSLDITGTVQADGSVMGTSFTDTLGRNLPWTMPAGSASEVLNYTAAVTACAVSGNAATFTYTIPNGLPGGLSGLLINMSVQDGGSPGAGNDTFGFSVGSGPTGFYDITGGNLVVH